MSTVPEKPTLDGLEAKWDAVWESQGTYRFDRTATRAEVFSIDTPPPTSSGSLHIGHVFSYSHTDMTARYRRMAGAKVFYPMGWDDNGLPTERRVQNYFGVRCDPTLPYEAGFEPPADPPKDPINVSRKNFVELCERLIAIDEKAFEDVFRYLGLSVDWQQRYTTIDAKSRTAAQRMFLRDLGRGNAYSQEAPTLWDIDFKCAVAQAELEDREMPGAYHRIMFDDIAIETTRPELIPACVALVAHPDDERYKSRFETTVRTPLFGVEVPIKAHHLADPEKGSGIAMICTFGDTTDVTWWRELQLPMRAIVGRDGRFSQEAPDGVPENDAWQALKGLTSKQAQKKIVELLTESGDLVGEPRAITHPVKFYEKGDRPLEIVTSRQWYIRNGGRDAALRDELLSRGKELAWHPDHMQARYENWVSGLNGDWLISRQRFFGVPFPVWYSINAEGEPDFDNPILAAEDTLPIDPSSDTAPGYDESQRGAPGGFIGDSDVMDTWATSSLSPQIAGGWEHDEDLFARVFPMDMRPQAHDIIRTWLFSTVVRAHFEHGSLPWLNACISGWILDPDRKKMSKSKGNVVTPIGLLEQYSTDAVRYWAGRGRPGTDTAFDEAMMKIGRRLAVKLLNASKFALGFPEPSSDAVVSEPVDLAMLAALATVVEDSTTAFEGFDYARALDRSEAFFWTFCDDYVELVKGRAYAEGAGAQSARLALRVALETLLKLFAPFLVFATEEVWSWWQEGSVHNAPWPVAADIRALATGGDAALLGIAGTALSQVRKAKSDAKASMRAPVEKLVIRNSAALVASLKLVEEDLALAGVVASIEISEGEPTVEVTLAPPAAE